jgi:hypothetical protein
LPEDLTEFVDLEKKDLDELLESDDQGAEKDFSFPKVKLRDTTRDESTATGLKTLDDNESEEEDIVDESEEEEEAATPVSSRLRPRTQK